MKKIRAAVIGCGAISHNCHIPGFKKNKYAELVALVDPDSKNLKLAREKFGVEKGYKSIDDLFDHEEIDAIAVASPNAFHAEHAIIGLHHQCHVLCEKPLCLNLKDASKIQRAVSQAGTIFMVAFTHRLYTGNIKAKQRIEKGEIGKPYMLRIRFAHQGPRGWAMSNWFFTPAKSGGGALFDMGIHAIDLAAYYLGNIKRVNAMIANLGSKLPVEDNAILQFEFESGPLGYAEVGWTSSQGFAGVEIHGDKGAIVNDYINGAFLVRGESTPSGKRVERRKVIDKNPCIGGWDVEIDHFVDAIRKNRQPEMGIEAGIRSLRCALAAYASAEKGKTITV